MIESGHITQVSILIFSQTQEPISVTAVTNQSALLNISQQHTTPIRIGCRNGGCGACKVKVLKGHYYAKVMSKAHITEQELKDNIVLACRIFPMTDLELKVLKPK